ncbi:prenyltransferase beta subunit [Saccharothrix tamanrassetensis]|uniref:Prenyltransferase beta subunit n=1 Tax=Saccharothrix tamanrassetensis TaxID=1051531 RepID=A0A841CZH8_9PSEU|nr:prenyltransferase/squalene oxidase repeat-containing protein [Saccharothrix tamanrassetensis]MBB5960716.1 prenyltransferase beta subunit [Saccharothrix tamanrassetensis]
MAAPTTARKLARRLGEHLRTQIDHRGRARSACGSRVLESVLTCRLLEDDARYPTALAAVRSYLRAAGDRDDLTPVDQVLLGTADARNALAGFGHHTAGRKRVLMSAILHAAGVPEAPAPPPTVVADGSLHTWKQAELTACRVICARAAGTAVPDDHLDTLAGLLLRPQIFEGNHLPHLLFLHALRPYPAHRVAVRHGLDLLVATQHADGGFSVAEYFDTWVSSIVATALTEAGTGREVVARTAAWLAACQSGDGGWSYTPQATQTDMDTTYTVMVFLHNHDPARYAPHLQAGHAYARGMQNTDGGWPTYRRGSMSEPAMTGGALVVLAQHPDAHAEQIVAGARWLAGVQKPDGTFERGWSLAEGNAIFRAVHGLCAARGRLALPPTVADAVDHALSLAAGYLERTQNRDGGWGHHAGRASDPVSTGYALAALGRLHRMRPVPSALEYLAARQRPDGGFDAPADTAAPRPIPVDVPVLAPAYVLRGLARCGG